MSSRARIRRLHFAALAIAAVAVSMPAVWADSNSQFTAQEFLDPIKYLASDQLKGRGDGTPELDKAARYIAHHFHKVGLKPGGDNGTYLQHFTLVVGAKLGRKQFPSLPARFEDRDIAGSSVIHPAELFGELSH